jgi:hypothetical protein
MLRAFTELRRQLQGSGSGPVRSNSNSAGAMHVHVRGTRTHAASSSPALHAKPSHRPQRHSHVKAFLAGLLQAAANGGKKRNVRTAQRGEVKTFVYVQQRTLLSRAYRTRSVRARVRPSLVNSPERKKERKKKHLFFPCAWSGHVSASSPSRSNGSAPSAPAAASSLARVTRCTCTVTAPTAGRCRVDARHGVLVRGGPWRGAAASLFGQIFRDGWWCTLSSSVPNADRGVMHACKLAVPDMSRLIRRVPRVETRRTTNLFLQQ